jgi:16S rRNA (uracil1498-N3)-methyltransferase
MEYYFTDKKNVSETSLVIKGDESKHLLRVLRKSKGEEIYVTDGERNLYKTVIAEINRDEIKCNINEKLYDINESEIRITLYLSLLKNPSRFEFVIEKATELGVYEITPVITHNVINKEFDKHKRWQLIALSAMKQSQRCYLPKVNHPVNFTATLNSAGKNDLKVIADERNFENSICADELKRLTSGTRPVSLLIGPEGGFTNEEIDTAVKHGFAILSLGERKLRSETAAIAALSILLTK